MIDIKLINNFRKIIIEDDNIMNKYLNILKIQNDKLENRNQWNCICSCMDWITVSVQHIKANSSKDISEFTPVELYAYISSVDSIVEAVRQLHRVIIPEKENTLPFKNESTIFKGNPFVQNDFKYFKNIRACFGAHSVNLEDPYDRENKSKRRFASWSYSYGSSSYSIVIYSNWENEENEDGKPIFLSISLDEINSFAEKYYNYLNYLGESIEDIKHIVKFRRLLNTNY